MLGVQTLFAGSPGVDIADLAADPAHVLPARELPEVGAEESDLQKKRFASQGLRTSRGW